MEAEARLGRLVEQAVDAEVVRDAVRSALLTALEDEDAALILDETGFIKKGTHSPPLAASPAIPSPASGWAERRRSLFCADHIEPGL
jgi:hypothetical protein